MGNGPVPVGRAAQDMPRGRRVWDGFGPSDQDARDMDKKWNPETRSYEYHATGLYVDGIDYDAKGALKKWEERGGATNCRKQTAQTLIAALIAEKASFEKHHLWLEEMERRIVARNAGLVDSARGKVFGGGLQGKIAYASIPVNFRPAIKAIVEAPGHHATYDRGAHQTCPAAQTGGFSQYREFHLTATRDGRAVTAVRDGIRYIYYSTTHAASTYNYQLVVFPFRLANMALPVEMPMMGGTKDGLIANP